MRAYLGVDAGGSHTRALLVSEDGEVMGAGRSGPANFRTGAVVHARVAVRDAVRQAIDQASSRAGPRQVIEVAAAFLGSAGLEDTGDEKLAWDLLGGAVAPRRLGLDSDVYTAWAGAFAGEPGVVLSAGTGSICLGVTESGRRIRVGGWGPAFGDEGSAYAIARQGIEAALAMADGRGAATQLLDELLRFTDIAEEWGSGGLERYGTELTNWLYSPGRYQPDIAGFAPLVENAALRGDPVALKILDRAGIDLAVMAATVVRQFEADGPPVRLATNGSVLRGDGPVRVRFLAALEAEKISAAIAIPRFPPEAGAALLAMQLGGHELRPNLLERLASSAPMSNAAQPAAR